MDGEQRSVALPARFRNANFTRAALEWLILTVLFFIPVLAVPFAYKWFFAVLFAAAGATSVSYFLASRRVDLVVSDDGLALGGVFRSRNVVWQQIARFEIREPWRRTPFTLAFAPWVDQAKVVLSDGSTVRIRAIEPWHGFTVLTYLAIQRYTEADRTVDALNSLLASRTGIGA